MSYADVTASSGPKQSASEKAAPPLPEIAHDDLDVHSIDSLASTQDDLREVGGVNPLPSYADQQKAEEEAARAKQNVQEAAAQAGQEAQAFGERAQKDAQRLGEQAQKEGKQVERDVKQTAEKAEKEGKQFVEKAEKEVKQFADKAGEKFDEVKGAAKKEYERTKKDFGLEDKADEVEREAKKAEQWAEKNKKNPVVLGNAVVLSALTLGLGIGAFRLHRANALTWKVAGVWAGALGLFAVGDYFVSQFFFQRYPPK